MNRLAALFNFRGRLRRGAFFLRLAIVLLAFLLLDGLLEPSLGELRVALLNPLALWLLLCACAQRLHDRDRSARWLLVGLVPVVGAAWLLWQFCRRGVTSDNRWGPDPLHPVGDFLVVE